MAKTKRAKVKIICVAAAALAAAAIAAAAARRWRARGEKGGDVCVARMETYENVIEIAGTVSAADEQKLQAKSDGTVLGVFVKKGDKVAKGDLILQLDAQEQEYNLARLDYDMASAKISGSQRELDLLRKQRLSLIQKIDDRKIVAMFPGIIADLDVLPGDSLEAKDSVGTLVNVDYLEAEVEIPETEVSSLRAGQEVDMTFPACERNVIGYVSGWPAIGTVTSRGATVVKAKVRVDDYPPEILPNYSFTGKIKIAPSESFIVVDRRAVSREEGRQFVVDAKSGEKIFVKAEPYGASHLKIAEGDVDDGEALKALQPQKVSGLSAKGGAQGRPRPAGPPPAR